MKATVKGDMEMLRGEITLLLSREIWALGKAREQMYFEKQGILI